MTGKISCPRPDRSTSCCTSAPSRAVSCFRFEADGQSSTRPRKSEMYGETHVRDEVLLCQDGTPYKSSVFRKRFHESGFDLAAVEDAIGLEEARPKSVLIELLFGL